jgi:hypothetical protein
LIPDRANDQNKGRVAQAIDSLSLRFLIAMASQLGQKSGLDWTGLDWTGRVGRIELCVDIVWDWYGMKAKKKGVNVHVCMNVLWVFEIDAPFVSVLVW